jgi:hypothetical protein
MHADDGMLMMASDGRPPFAVRRRGSVLGVRLDVLGLRGLRRLGGGDAPGPTGRAAITIHIRQLAQIRIQVGPCTRPWRSQVCTGLHWIALDCTGLHWIALDCTGLHWIALDCTGLHWIALDCTGLHLIALDWPVAQSGVLPNCIALTRLLAMRVHLSASECI